MATTTTTPPTPTLPIPISKLAANTYLLYSTPAITYLRHTHHILGNLIGSLPQAPQQNVFLGLPLQLMPEEARLLVEKGVAFLVEDGPVHKRAFLDGDLSVDERRAFQVALRRQGVAAAKSASARKVVERKRVEKEREREKGQQSWNDVPEDMLRSSGERRNRGRVGDATPEEAQEEEEEEEESLFPSPTTPASITQTATISTTANTDPEPYQITPTTSHPPLPLPLPPPPLQSSLPLPSVPTSYPLFHHLHTKNYFLFPGLRFGCNYMAYPGDPLRFHSHFLCKGLEWDQEFDLLELVGGGRLGTGVKKCWLLGGREEEEKEEWGWGSGTGFVEEAGGKESEGEEEGEGSVRCFCIEWGGM